MKHFILAVLAALVTVPAQSAQANEATPSALEASILKQAEACAPFREGTPKMLLKMLRLEAEYGVPAHLRGITVAIACREAQYNTAAEGDHKFSKDGKTPMAIGLFQMWPFWKTRLGINRRDPYAATKGWLNFVKGRIPKVKSRCGFHKEADQWRVAITYAMRGPGNRCHQSTTHYRMVKQWHGQKVTAVDKHSQTL